VSGAFVRLLVEEGDRAGCPADNCTETVCGRQIATVNDWSLGGLGYVRGFQRRRGIKKQLKGPASESTERIDLSILIAK
jgi:hypothetical protein